MSGSGSITAARAFLSAGNFRLAEEHLAQILAKDPGEREACAAWCDLLLKQEKFSELESFCLDWLSRDVGCEIAYVSLIGAVTRRGDRAKAMSILEQFEEFHPSKVEHRRALLHLIDFNCPAKASRDAPSRYEAVIAQSKKANDEGQVLRWQSQAAFARGDFDQAMRLGDLSWAAGYTATSFASYMAMISFRSFRFEKSRRYARLVLLAEPQHAIAKELLFLTRLVWFPPFLVAHASLLLLTRKNSRRGFGSTAAMSILAALWILAANFIESPALFVSIALLMISYYIYIPNIGLFTRVSSRFRPTALELTGY